MAQQSSSSFDLMCVDDSYLLTLFNEEEEVEENDQAFTVSDEKFAELLQFQEALMASIITAQMSNHLASSSSSSSSKNDQGTAAAVVGKDENGESSKRVCEICVEMKDSDEMFQIERCSHSFCTDCVSRHVVSKIQDSKKLVTCPGLECESKIEIDACRSVIPLDVVSRWDEMLCESMILASQKYYCPFKDCSALLVNDSEEVIRESVCPLCHRLFCAQCHVPWHPGIECEEFQRLNEDERGREDLMAMQFAKEKNWKRCPNCRFYVERNEGCLHMTCRCGFQFCYACGAKWTSTHGGCQRRT